MTPLLINNYIFKITISLLIILGGLGVLSLTEVFSFNLRKQRTYKTQRFTPTTKLVLASTASLIAMGTILIYLGDYRSSVLGQNLLEKIFNAYFQSVTARTAGFNTVAIDQLSVFSTIIIIFLMWIGASPGGTGGGIKTTTFTIGLLFLYKYLRGQDRLEIYSREVDFETIKKAIAIILLSIFTIILGTSFLILLEANKNPLNLLFEVVSAFSTVGLSRNTTFHIGDASKFVLVWVMFIGRIGVLTFFTSLFSHAKEYNYSLPKVNINVG